MCDDPTHLWNESWSEILVVTHFKDPPHLEVLGHLLSVMETESCKYKVYPNCYFFCSVIYEILFSMSGGENVKGTPSHLSLSLAPRVRASIKEKMDELRLVPLVHRVSRQQTLETESMIKPPTPPENSEKTQEDTSIGDKPNASTPQEAQMGYQDVSLGIDLVLSLLLLRRGLLSSRSHVKSHRSHHTLKFVQGPGRISTSVLAPPTGISRTQDLMAAS
ncbi:hypothetical protein BS47DRAFT_1133896 [Hydnum rufescens UP504]|uniref:Uncharacterized protein n=1 Tax=Hydnum rufescens UP504 TaxID=1448309 RepID=A0A9P6AVY9_9AGAM|nr:hypothetical protein BS47DRAFT_1133896 [Hydnum rufescens UP504]